MRRQATAAPTNIQHARSRAAHARAGTRRRVANNARQTFAAFAAASARIAAYCSAGTNLVRPWMPSGRPLSCMRRLFRWFRQSPRARVRARMLCVRATAARRWAYALECVRHCAFVCPVGLFDPKSMSTSAVGRESPVSPGADVAGASPVPVQMWRGEPRPETEQGWLAQSRC